jgi:hypothetical protein
MAAEDTISNQIVDGQEAVASEEVFNEKITQSSITVWSEAEMDSSGPIR